MFPRAVLLLLLSCLIFCQAEETMQTAIKADIATSTMSQPVILLLVTVCTTIPVLSIIIPTLIYYKYCEKDLQDQIV